MISKLILLIDIKLNYLEATQLINSDNKSASDSNLLQSQTPQLQTIINEKTRAALQASIISISDEHEIVGDTEDVEIVGLYFIFIKKLAVKKCDIFLRIIVIYFHINI